jgi:hypothetical protein
MIVSDIRYSVSVLDHDEQGHRITRHFDDPGCFQAFAKAHPAASWSGVAHDFRQGRELPLDQVTFIQSHDATPMGSGVVAVSKEEVR